MAFNVDSSETMSFNHQYEDRNLRTNGEGQKSDKTKEYYYEIKFPREYEIEDAIDNYESLSGELDIDKLK